MLNLKETVDTALAKSPSVKHCLVVKRVGNDVNDDRRSRDLLVARHGRESVGRLSAEQLDSETPLFILYTSGSTGKPKGIMHTTAGYNLYVKKTFQWVFDHRDDDVYWCTADCGWVTGHSYIVYGPLSAGATTVMYEAPRTSPRKIAFGTSSRSTASPFSTRRRRRFARSLSWGDHHVDKHDLSSLRLLGTWAKGSIPKRGCVLQQDRRRSLAPLWIRGG